MEALLRTILDGEILVLRNHETLPQTTGGSDLDVLVHPADGKLTLNKVISAVELNQAACIGVTSSDAFYKASIIIRDSKRAEYNGVCIDIFSGLAYRGADLIDVDVAFNLAEERDGFMVLPPWASAIIAVVKELLNNSRMPDKYAVFARNAFASNEDAAKQLLEPIGPRSFAKLQQICITGFGEDNVRFQATQLRRLVRLNAIKKSGFRFVKRWSYFHFSRFQRMLSPTGLVVAILGPDGSGKSTIIKAIAPVIEAASHTPLAIRHLRPTLLPSLGSIARLGQKSDTPATATDPHGSAPAGAIGSLARLIWLWIDYVFGYLAVVRPKIAKAPVVFLFDRYADDLAIDPRRFRIGRFGGLARLMPKFVPRPDLVIVLFAEPELIHSRKPELPLAEIERQNQALRNWVAKRKEAILIDTSGSIEEAQDKVLEAIISKARERSDG